MGRHVDRLQRPPRSRPTSRHDCPSRSLATRIAATTHAIVLIDRCQELLEVANAEVDFNYVLAPRIREVGRQQTNPNRPNKLERPPLVTQIRSTDPSRCGGLPCKSKAQIEFTVRKALTRPTSRPRRPAPGRPAPPARPTASIFRPPPTPPVEAAESGGVRTDLVNLIRGQIATGTYDTPEKMDIAMERLLDQMG